MPVICCSFKPENIDWSKSTRELIHKTSYQVICSCSNQYILAANMMPQNGFIILNQSYMNHSTNFPPTYHINYAKRTKDFHDNLPKYENTFGSNRLFNNNSNKKQDDDGNRINNHNNRNVDNPNYDIKLLHSDSFPIINPHIECYNDINQDPPINHHTKVSPQVLSERVKLKYNNPQLNSKIIQTKSNNKYLGNSNDNQSTFENNRYDAIIIGGGHNGLISAAYLAKAGFKTIVLERRHCVGGAAVTEEIIPGFKFSRASYLAGLLRPSVIAELELEKYNFKYLARNPSSFTPTKHTSIYGGKYLMLGDNADENFQSIAQFSLHDAHAYEHYEAFLSNIREIMQPILDNPPMDLSQGKAKEKLQTLQGISTLVRLGYRHKEVLVPFYELFTGPASQILDRWFESDILKTTLATDAVIGALISPKQSGSAYVLLHHVMGEAGGKKGVWSYVEGGMGAVSDAIAQSALHHDCDIATNTTVRKILYKNDSLNSSTNNNRVTGVELDDGTVVHGDIILSGCSPYHTFLELLPSLSHVSGYYDTNNNEYEPQQAPLPDDFTQHIRFSDYSCGAFKINLAVNKLPNFTCYPSPKDGSPGPMHRGTIHFECHMDDIYSAYNEASLGKPATRPLIEMTIPSSIDTTLTPISNNISDRNSNISSYHVVQLFIQYAPYEIDPKIGSWSDPQFKKEFTHRCLSIVEEYCPGFIESIVGMDVLSPLDLEQIFGLHRGNIHHGSLSLHQLGYNRPMHGFANHRTPLKGLYLCGSGAHPGGGVMGAAGRNCARVVLSDYGK
eukprot:gene5498-7611_t